MRIFTFAGICCFFFACKAKQTASLSPDQYLALKIDMMETDRAFSALSEQKGLRTAFMDFIDSNGVLLRPGTVPLVAGDAMDFITQSNDTGFVMTWEPRDAGLSASGDLGYTYGVYSLRPSQTDTVIYGSYVSVWKKQPDGKWKFMLQSGNEGVE
jgi:hypothetical protein